MSAALAIIIAIAALQVPGFREMVTASERLGQRFGKALAEALTGDHHDDD